MDGETASLAGTQRWTERGSGPTVLLLHGIYAGAGGHEWARLAPLIETGHTVRVPDLVGFGSSDRPAIPFTSDVVADAVARLVDELDPDATVVASSLTGAYALGAVARSRRPPALVLITPTGMGSAQSRRPPAAAGLLEQLWRRTPLGDLLTVSLLSTPSVRWFLRRQAYADPGQVSDETVRQHQAAGRRPNAKYPLVAFVTGALARPVDTTLVAQVRPTVVWGDGQSFTATRDADRWAAAGADVVHLPSGLPQAEEPASVAEVVLRVASRGTRASG
jgi:pimeloyl-ACP methyl ester carboxylesterase